MGKKPLRSFEGGEAYGDSIHKIGHGFKVDQSDLNHIKELNLVNYDLGYEMVKNTWDVPKPSLVVSIQHGTHGYSRHFQINK